MIKLKDINTIIFWGAAWGIVEGTVGYLVHLSPVKVGWAIWFPLAFYFLNKVYTETKQKRFMIYVAFIASGIKLVNLLMETRIDRVLNPAASIIFEALAMIVVCRVLEKKVKYFKLFEILSVNLIWRTIYTVYLIMMPESFLKVSHLRGIEPSIKFFLLDNIGSSLVIFSCIKIGEKLFKNKEKIKISLPKPVITFSMLILAFAIQWII